MEEGGDFVAEVALDGDFAVLGGAADAAFDLEGAAELLEVGLKSGNCASNCPDAMVSASFASRRRG